MIFRELRRHQWKAFRRHPMFEREMALKVFMFFLLVMLGLYFAVAGLLLFDFLSEYGVYNNAIESFNYILIYLLLSDFSLKYMWKKSLSMQIAPYLTIPIKRSKLFNFVLVKEFTNMWNLYLFFLLIPFVFRAIPVYYGNTGVVLYLLFFYLLCICISLLVNIANNLLDRSSLYLFLPVIIVTAIIGITLIPDINIEDRIVTACKYILERNNFAWAITLLAFLILWKVNLLMMKADIYRALQGEKVSDTVTFTIPFVNKLGKYGMFLNLELRMILRSKRLKQLLYCIFLIPIYSLMANFYKVDSVFFLFATIYLLGFMGIGMGQNLFITESSFFDGLMTKKLSLLDMLKSKYIFYVFCSLFISFFLMISVFIGSFDFLFLISVFFYTIGPVYFIVFRNVVYNNKYYNHFDNKLTNLDLITGSTFLITMLGLLIPIIVVMIFILTFNMTIAYYFMLITGIIFTLMANFWLTWTYNRFLKRKYKNMEGFRIKT